jgi:type III secretion protein R
MRWGAVVLGALGLLLPSVAHAEELSLGSRPLSVLLLLGALSLLPFVLVMVTSFARIAVVLSILRSALGTPQIPPTMVITGLALILTVYVMAPTGQKVIEAVQPVIQTGQGQGLVSPAAADAIYGAAVRAKEPVREFLVRHSKPADRAMFRDLSRRMRPAGERAAVGERDLLVVIPAFVIGELAAAFQIGFLLFIPFLVIDMVVANILLALGMHMLSPTTVSLPFKLLLFVLVDGWHLLTQGLVLSYL